MKRAPRAGKKYDRPPRAPFEKRANEMRKELDRVQKALKEQVAKVKRDAQATVDVARAAQTRAETQRDQALFCRADVTRLHRAQRCGWLGRVWFRLWYLFSGRIA